MGNTVDVWYVFISMLPFVQENFGIRNTCDPKKVVLGENWIQILMSNTQYIAEMKKPIENIAIDGILYRRFTGCHDR